MGNASNSSQSLEHRLVNSASLQYAVDALANLPDLALKCSNIHAAERYCVGLAHQHGTDTFIARFNGQLIMVDWDYSKECFNAKSIPLTGIRVLS